MTRPSLAVVSHTPHHRADDGALVGFEPTVRELDHLAGLFDRVVHVAPLHDGPPTGVMAPYRATNVTLEPVRPAGGDTVAAKLGALARAPVWRRVIRDARRDADLLHVRAPAAIALVALTTRGGPCWAKYAGTWRPAGRDALGYRLQRRLLRAGIGTDVVTVNGRAEGDPDHVVGFDNPSLTEADLAAGGARRGERLSTPLRVVCAGRVEAAKGTATAVEAVALAAGAGTPVHLDVVGDGPDATLVRDRLATLAPPASGRWHGWLRRDALLGLLRTAHLVLLPSRASEGWPKVLSEGMGSGAVPVAGDVSTVAAVLRECGCGTVVAPHAADGYAAAIEAYAREPGRWARERDAGLGSAPRFGYAAYLDAVRDLIGPLVAERP